MILLYSALILGILGFGFGTLLAYSAKVFEVKEDPRIERIIAVLPGINCGMCGYPGCEAYARAIVKKKEDPGKCVPGKPSNVEEKIRKILSEKMEE